MPRSSLFATSLALLSLAVVPHVSQADPTSSRVFVSATLNDGIFVIDAESLEITQPLLPSRGSGPVRIDVESFDGHPYLFTANHGVASSVGVFDLAGDIVLETPASPFPTGGFGAVAIDVAHTGRMAVTNTWFALGGCSMPAGSVSVYRIEGAAGAIAPVLEGSYSVRSPIPWGTAVDTRRDGVIVSTNCGDELEFFDSGFSPVTETPTHTRTGQLKIGSRPDGTLYDEGRDRSYTVNIGSHSLTVVDAETRTIVTTVPLPAGSGPIDAALASSYSGADWILTSNGGKDTFSIIDRNVIETCVEASATSCPSAVVNTISAFVPGGAPEGISYDPVSNRVFVVNKTIGAPKLSAIQLTESGGTVTGTLAGIVDIPAAHPDIPVPAVIAFDAAVQVRA